MCNLFNKRRKLIRPKALKVGDTIGIVSPSEPVSVEDRRMVGLRNGIKVLENMGFNTILAPNALKSLSYMAGTPEERVHDIHTMFESPEVQAIMCSWGGKSANQLLDLLDYDLIADHPKIFSGFSDPANILNAVYAKTGLITFYGPNIVGKLQPIGKTVEYFQDAVVTGKIGLIKTSAPRNIIKQGKKVKGTLIGGNLTCFDLGLLGTPYQPDFSDAILFWETGTNIPQRISQFLSHYRLNGVFDKIAGMIIGYLGDSKESREWRERSVKETVLDATEGYDFPIMQINCFGHGDIENITVPIGCKAFMDTNKKEFGVFGKTVT